MLIPIKVAKIIPGRIPRVPPRRLWEKGVCVAPKYMVTRSPGRQLITRRKKQRKMEWRFCFSMIACNLGYFRASLLT